MGDRLVGFAAFKEGRDDYGVLPTKPNQLLNRLRRIIGEQWSAGTDAPSVRNYTGTLDRLRSFLLQARRMRDHEAALVSFLRVQRATGGHTFQAVHAGDEACADFESLLFHGRAVLDRLTLLVAREHGQHLDRFSRLEKFLEGSVEKTARVKGVVDLLTACKSISGAVVDLEGRRSLRSRVIHRSSLSEGIASNFMVLALDGGRVLFLDCEAFGHGVLTLSRELAEEIPFLVLNTLKLYLGAGKLVRGRRLRTR